MTKQAMQLALEGYIPDIKGGKNWQRLNRLTYKKRDAIKNGLCGEKAKAMLNTWENSGYGAILLSDLPSRVRDWIGLPSGGFTAGELSYYQKLAIAAQIVRNKHKWSDFTLVFKSEAEWRKIGYKVNKDAPCFEIKGKSMYKGFYIKKVYDVKHTVYKNNLKMEF